MNKRLWVTLSLALMSATAHAAVPASQIEKIEILIEDGNWVELRAYLSANPRLLLGEDVLAAELRRFMEDTENLFTALIFEPGLFPDTTDAQVIPDPPPQPTRVASEVTRNAEGGLTPDEPEAKAVSTTVVVVDERRGDDDNDDDDDDDSVSDPLGSETRAAQSIY